jgi:phage-related protein
VAAGPSIVAKFLADTSQMVKEVKDGTDNASSKMGAFAKGAATSIATGFSAVKIVEFGKASVDAAAADQEAQVKLATTLKNVTGATDAQVKSSEDYITKLSKSAAIADDDLRPALDNLVRGFGNTEDATKALGLATDISAGTGKDLGAVSEALMKAAMGSTGALSKMGVETKNADGSAKSLNQIMSDLSTTFSGQAAASADTAAGKMRGAKIQFGEFQETLGTALLPILGMFAGALNAIIPVLSRFAPIIVPLAAAFALWNVAVSVATAVQTAFGVSLGISVGWLALIVVAIAALVAGIIWAYNNVDWFRAGVQAAFKVISVAFDVIVDAAKAVWGWVSDHWPLLLVMLTGPIGGAVLLITKHWDTIKDGATAVWQWVVDKWDAIAGGIGAAVGVVGGVIRTLTDLFRLPMDAATAMYEWIRDKFDALAGVISGIVGAIAGAIGSVVNAIKSPINALIGAWNRLEFKVPSVTLPKISIPGIGDIGGGSFGGQVIGFPNLPTLAGGGVLTSATLFVGGEAGTEIVSPEALMRQIVAEEGGGHYTLNIYPRTADAADIAYGFRRLELMAGLQ